MRSRMFCTSKRPTASARLARTRLAPSATTRARGPLRRLAAVAPLVLAASLAPRTARAAEADDDATPALAAALGAVTALAPLGVGTLMMARGHDLGVRNAGVFVAQSGFVVGPILAHGALGEWGRGALFALPPLAAQVGMVPVFASYPDVQRRSPIGVQYLYAGFWTLSVFSGAAGVLDVLRSRAPRERAGRVHVSPLVAPGLAGAQVGGAL